MLSFGIPEIDQVLPGGGLKLGALHEVAGGANGVVDSAAVARTKGRILWCVTRQDLFAQALSQAGLAPGRAIHVEVGDEAAVLADHYGSWNRYIV